MPPAPPRTASGACHVFPGRRRRRRRPRPAAGRPECPASPRRRRRRRSGVPSGGRAVLDRRDPRELRGGRGAPAAVHATGSPCRFDGHPDGAGAVRRSPPEPCTPAPDPVECSGGAARCSAADGVRYVGPLDHARREPEAGSTPGFFLARAPEGQAYAHDDTELIGSEWVRPGRRARAHAAGDFPMNGPTAVCLRTSAASPPATSCSAAHEPHPQRSPPEVPLTEPAVRHGGTAPAAHRPRRARPSAAGAAHRGQQPGPA
jgi:hypothetical protein